MDRVVGPQIGEILHYEPTVPTSCHCQQLCLDKLDEGCASWRFSTVTPNPATDAILTVWEAGESVFHTFLWTNAMFHALRGAKPLFHALFCVKTLSGKLWAPPSMHPGYGAR